jgi:hypothetical protein
VAEDEGGEDGEAHAESAGEGDPEWTEAREGEAGHAGPAPRADQAAVAEGWAGEAHAEPAGEGDPERAIARLARELVTGLPEPRRRALRALLADERARELLIGHLRGELAEPAEGATTPAELSDDFEKTADLLDDFEKTEDA